MTLFVPCIRTCKGGDEWHGAWNAGFPQDIAGLAGAVL